MSTRALPVRRFGFYPGLCAVALRVGLLVWLIAPLASADLPRPRPPTTAQPRPKVTAVPVAATAAASASAAAAPSVAAVPSAVPPAEPAPKVEASALPSSAPAPIPTETFASTDAPPDKLEAADARSAQAARASFLIAAAFVGLLAGFWALMRWRKSRLAQQIRAMEERDS